MMGMGMGMPSMQMGQQNYAPIDHMAAGDIDFDPLSHLAQGTPPQPPHDNNQVAAWYDTDL